ncbi:hypothetical protein BJV82DRAFT_584087 [Fennellomyces sp. T-0311]|nr:hypothetical protein BJV82DRAFT_584087 [Fennellomyces sp. T-0311]
MHLFSSTSSSNKQAAVPLQDMHVAPAILEQEVLKEPNQDQPMQDDDDVHMSESISHMDLNKETVDPAKEKAKPRKKRASYDKYDPVKVKNALQLVYVEKKGIPMAAEQSGIKKKTLEGLLRDLVKNHGYPPVPKVPRTRTPKVRSARTDPEIAMFFEQTIKPQLK